MLLGEGELTTHQLHERLPDVPIATLYRHVGHLAAQELIEVADEQRIRGANEKTYRLSSRFASGVANPSAEEVNALSTEELLTAFTVFTSGLIRDFDDYMQAGEADLAADRVSFAQASFWADDDEIDEFGRALMTALKQLLGNEPGSGRRRRTLTTVLMPREPAGAQRSGRQAQESTE